MMKRKIALLLMIICLLTAMLPGCAASKEPGKLRILIDQPNHSLHPETELRTFLFKAVKEGILDSIDQVEIEVVPNDGMNVEARNGELTRIRAEIVSGAGPDIFIIGTGSNIYETPYQILFQYPNGVMAQHRFLELDEYIENAEYMDWEALNPIIMQAGSYDGSQYLLPMSYTFPATVYNIADTDVTEDPVDKLGKTTTWQDMLDSDDKLIRHAADPLFSAQSLNRVASVFGATDDGRESLTFPREDLYDIFETGINQNIEQTPNMVMSGQTPPAPADTGLPENCRFDMGRGFDDPDFGLGYGDISGWDMSIVPMCSMNGGVTATVTSYCCINANSPYADTAFRLIDLLMSRDVQQTSGFTCTVGLGAFPIYDGLMQEDRPVYHIWRGDHQWSMSDGNYQSLCRARELITEAKLISNTEEYLTLGFAECMLNAGKLDEVVDRVYREMKMGLAES